MKISLGRKIVLLVIVVAVIMSGTCILVSGYVNRKTMDAEYMITADSMAGTVAVMADGDKLQEITQKVMAIYDASTVKYDATQWEESGYQTYLEQYEALTEDPVFIEMQKELRAIQDVSEVDCVYTLYPCPDEKTLVYIVDAAYGEDFMQPGSFDFAEESCYPYLNDLEQGLPAFITNTKEYGWVVTACVPIHNSKGEFVCFAAVDLSMNDVLEKENKFLYMLALILSVLTFIICVIAILYVNQKIVKPINMLSVAAGQYGRNASAKTHNYFSSMNIRTGDELEILLSSMKQMERDIDNYIDNLTQTRQQLSTVRQQADDLHELAHMDSLTGIRNRMAYDKEITRLDTEIENGLKDFGIVMIDLNSLKAINDTYGHECGNLAIKKLSSLICDIFVHSPVFRIGGDEFAVILRNKDYDRVEELTKEFEECMGKLKNDETLDVWERISAALGYALFDTQQDHNADDVFKRADEKMYENKKAMKKSGN